MDLLGTLLDWGLPTVFTICLGGGAIWTARRALPNSAGSRISRQMSVFAIVILSMILLVVALPFPSDTRGQLLSLFGLVITAVIGLASTTFVSNAMAGFMLRSVASFHAGDFIRVGTHFGRVTETALFHTEIQSEDRDLITLPNLFLVTQPVRVVHSSGTLISTEVSLGYDVHRRRIRDLLKTAAEKAQLNDPFVQTTSLGDFAVSYRVSGFLQQVTSLVSKRTELNNAVLDALQGDNVEIVSPGFMNQRQLDPTTAVLPRRRFSDDADEDTGQAEKLMFDKAEMAGRLRRFQQQRDELTAAIKSLEESDPEANKFEISWREHQLASLKEIIDTLDNEPLEIR